MKTVKDPFEAAFNEQGDSPPDVTAAQTQAGAGADNGPDEDYDYGYESDNPNTAKPSAFKDVSRGTGANALLGNKAKEDEEEDEEDNMDVEPPNSDPDKMAKMQ